MKTLTHVSNALFLVLLTSCKGSTFRPIVDTQGIDFNRFESDLQQCQQFSTQTNDAATSAAVGATAGAVLGSVMAGVIGGDRGATAKLIAIEGAIVGGASGETNQRNIIRR